MLNKLRLLIILNLILTTVNVDGQEMAGLVHSNHAGTNVLFFNPAGLHHQKDYLSINLITADFFLGTDYLYLDKNEFSFLNLVTGNLNLPMHPTGYSQGERPFYIYEKGNNTRFDFDIKIQGPSAMFIYRNHAIALFSAAKSYLTMRNISPDIGNLLYYGFGYTPQHQQKYLIKDLDFSYLGWGEIGLSYAYQWNSRSFSNWNFGISLKYLLGVGAISFHADEIEYTLNDDTTIDIDKLEANFEYSLPSNYNTDEFPVGPFINGKGFGVDIGIEYQELLERQAKRRVRACAQTYYPYKYRIGVSLMDIGYINFKNNAQVHNYTNTDYTWYRIDTMEYVNWNALMQEASQRFYGSPTATLKTNVFKMWLPSSINIDGDYNFENDIYLNASLVLGLPINGNYLQKPSIVSITPRFERRNFEFSIPVSLYQWKYPRVGMALRLYYFTIGSDYFTSLLGIHDFNGMDLYFSLKINFEKGSCERRNKINPCGDSHNKFPWSK